MSNSEFTRKTYPKGRKQTDQSLGAERAKTDRSLQERRQRTEHQTDKAISENRADADEARSLQRLDADASNRNGSKTSSSSISEGRSDADERLRKERESADEAMMIERNHVDSILEGERKRNGSDEHGLFEAERRTTDTDLTSERSQTDKDVEQATLALTSRDEFLAIVSHDLRNPLGAIAMAAQILAESPLYTAADIETRDCLGMIERNANEALRLIGDLMDMERIAAGKLGLQPEKQNIGELVRHSIQSFQHLAATKGIAFGVSSCPNNVTATCDRERVSQIMSNLIGNAIKFTPKGGGITLSVEATKNSVTVSVADTGPGISDDMQHAIFKRFWQIGKQDRRGLGLGLYISKMIVEAHHGQLTVKSKLGRGSTFSFTLPLS